MIKIKVLLNEKGYYTGTYCTIGDIADGLEVSCLPHDRTMSEQLFCKPTNTIIKVEKSKTPIYGIPVDIDNETKQTVTYIKIESDDGDTVSTEERPVIMVNGEQVEIPKDRVITLLSNPITGELTDIEYVQGSDISSTIIDYTINYVDKIITTWEFDSAAYKTWLDEETNKPVIKTDSELIAELQNDLKEKSELIAMLDATIESIMTDVIPSLVE